MLINIKDRDIISSTIRKLNIGSQLLKLPKEKFDEVCRFMEDNGITADKDQMTLEDFFWIDFDNVMDKLDYGDLIEIADSLEINSDGDAFELKNSIINYCKKNGIKSIVNYLDAFLCKVFIVDEDEKRYFVYRFDEW